MDDYIFDDSQNDRYWPNAPGPGGPLERLG